MRELGGYTLLRKLGSGGMSVVYEAIDGGGKSVAFKLFHPSWVEQPEILKRMQREVAMLRRIKSPYVAQILDAEFDEAEKFIVTELVTGLSLQEDVVENGRYTEEDLEELAHKLGEALQCIHQAGVLHRDLKPSNIMISEAGPVIIDFGIAQLAEDTRLTRQGLLAHTPGYCDPRVLRGAAPDSAADWWALTAVLAYAATGVPPFGAGLPDVIMQRVLFELPDLPNLAPDLADLFTLALSGKMENRIDFATFMRGLPDPQKVLPTRIIPVTTEEQTQVLPNTVRADSSVFSRDFVQDNVTELIDTEVSNTLVLPENSEAQNYPQYPASSPVLPLGRIAAKAEETLEIGVNTSYVRPTPFNPFSNRPSDLEVTPVDTVHNLRQADVIRGEVKNSRHLFLLVSVAALAAIWGGLMPGKYILALLSTTLILDVWGRFRQQKEERELAGAAIFSSTMFALVRLPKNLLFSLLRMLLAGVIVGLLGIFVSRFTPLNLFNYLPELARQAGEGGSAGANLIGLMNQEGAQNVLAGGQVSPSLSVALAVWLFIFTCWFWLIPVNSSGRAGAQRILDLLVPTATFRIFWLLVVWGLGVASVFYIYFTHTAWQIDWSYVNLQQLIWVISKLTGF